MSLLPICRKLFEKVLFNVFRFFLENNLINQKQSGLNPSDSCINQLLSITCGIYKSFHDGFEVSSFYLDISQAVDKGYNQSILHQMIIFKVGVKGISGDLLNILCDFLKENKGLCIMVKLLLGQLLIIIGHSNGR